MSGEHSAKESSTLEGPTETTGGFGSPTGCEQKRGGKVGGRNGLGEEKIRGGGGK